MRSSLIVIVVAGLSLGVRDANAARIVIADETTGLPHDFTSLTDSVVGSLCSNANEDTTACFATPYTVSAAFIAPAFRAAGGVAAVNLLDARGSDTPDNLSDQLYLTVSRQSSDVFTLTWCWDSDLEPNQNICPVPDGATVHNVVEPAFGFTNLTEFFTGPNGPLAAEQWTIRAQSEAPEPASLFLLGSGLAAGAFWFRKRRGF